MRGIMMSEISPMGNTVAVPPSFSQSESTPRWVWFALFGIIVAELVLMWWYARRETQVSAFQHEFDKEITLKLHGAVERRGVRKETFISGEIKGITKDPRTFSLENPASPSGAYRVVLTTQTKFYRFSNDTVPRKIALGVDDFPPGSFVTVISNEEIGKKDTVQALEVVKLR